MNTDKSETNKNTIKEKRNGGNVRHIILPACNLCVCVFFLFLSIVGWVTYVKTWNSEEFLALNFIGYICGFVPVIAFIVNAVLFNGAKYKIWNALSFLFLFFAWLSLFFVSWVAETVAIAFLPREKISREESERLLTKYAYQIRNLATSFGDTVEEKGGGTTIIRTEEKTEELFIDYRYSSRLSTMLVSVRYHYDTKDGTATTQFAKGLAYINLLAVKPYDAAHCAEVILNEAYTEYGWDGSCNQIERSDAVQSIFYMQGRAGYEDGLTIMQGRFSVNFFGKIDF